MAPLTALHVLPLAEEYHWYDKTPDATDAVTERLAAPPMLTLLLEGCVVIEGVGVALTTTDTEFELVDFDTPSFVAVATHL